MTVDVAALHAIPLFAAVREGNLRRISRVVQEQRVRPKTLLFAEGAPYSGLHIVKSGRVKIIQASRDKEQILAILGPGELVDPIPLLDGGNHSATAKAMESTVVYGISPDAARALLDAYPSVLAAVLNVMSGRLRKLASLANDLAFKDVTARVCKALIQYAPFEGERKTRATSLPRGLTRQELASIVGTSREVMWRAIKKLEKDGLIRIVDHQIVIVDAEGLAAML